MSYGQFSGLDKVDNGEVYSQSIEKSKENLLNFLSSLNEAQVYYHGRVGTTSYERQQQ